MTPGDETEGRITNLSGSWNSPKFAERVYTSEVNNFLKRAEKINRMYQNNDDSGTINLKHTEGAANASNV